MCLVLNGSETDAIPFFLCVFVVSLHEMIRLEDIAMLGDEIQHLSPQRDIGLALAVLFLLASAAQGMYDPHRGMRN